MYDKNSYKNDCTACPIYHMIILEIFIEKWQHFTRFLRIVFRGPKIMKVKKENNQNM